MLRGAKLLIVLVSAVTLLACAGAPQRTPAEITEAEIGGLVEEWLRAAREGDGVRAAAGYALDAILVTGDGRVDGQPAIQRYWAEAFTARPGNAETRLPVIKWGSSGDIGYALGGVDGGVTTQAGHWLAVVQRQEDSSLRIVAQISIPNPVSAQ